MRDNSSHPSGVRIQSSNRYQGLRASRLTPGYFPCTPPGCVFLLFLLVALPAGLSAQSGTQPGWTEQFLRNLRFSSAAPPPVPGALIGVPLQNGMIPITLQQVLAMMMDHNLDIRTNRYS